jgi:putative peptidoglycan lipid II flippase
MRERHGLLQSASLIGLCTVLSRILGYVRDSRIAFLLGAGAEADAFNAAYRVVNLLRRLVGEGAVGAAFIPVFSRYFSEDKRREAWVFADAAFAAMTVILAVVSGIGMLASPLIIRVLASGFAATPGKIAMAAELSRAMFPYLLMIGLAGLGMGMLHSLRRFGPPAFAPVLANVAIVGFSFLGGLFSTPSMALAAGVVVGGVLQAVVQFPALRREGWRPRLFRGLAAVRHHPELWRLARRMGPVVFGMGVVQLNVLVGIQFASRMKEGSVTAIGLADRVVELALGTYAIAISTAILPLLSRQAAEGRRDDLRATLGFACRLVLFITVPAGVGLAVLRAPIVEVLFQHGAFDARAAALTAWPLLFFALGLPAFSMVKILAPAFYASDDAMGPVRAAILAMTLNVALNVAFFGPLGHGGPALAASLAAYGNAGDLVFAFRRRYGGFGLRNLGVSLARCGAASAAMGLAAYLAIHIPGLYAGSKTQKAVALAFAIGAALGVYFGAARLMGASEPGELRGAWRSKGGDDEYRMD